MARYLKKMAILLFVSICFMQVSVSAASGIRLNRTAKTLHIGDKVTLKVKGTDRKVSWSVKGRKLVLVKTKGKKRQTAVITAVKAGSCFVEAKAGKKKLRCRIAVKKKEHASPTPTPAPLPVNPAYREKDPAVLGIADASVKLFSKSLAKSGEGRNVLISPASILTALTLAEYGAEGAARKEIEGLMGGVPADQTGSFLAAMGDRLGSDGSILCETADSIWYRKDVIRLKSSYLDKMKNLFHAEVRGAPFDGSTVKEMNDWVSAKTRGKIKKIIDELDPSSRVVLMNALYFKGQWGEPYAVTVKRTFTDGKGNKKDVPMLEGTEHSYVTMKGAEGFLKYYRGGTAAFLALLPPEGMSLSEYAMSLTGEDFVNCVKSARTSGILVHTRMPEFQSECEVKLTEVLKDLGVRTAFTPSADFSGMSGSPLMIDEVLHKTFIKLDKDGTEAAAVTAVVEKASSIRLDCEEKYVFLDRPFLYAVIDMKSGLPLFIGAVKSV